LILVFEKTLFSQLVSQLANGILNY